MVIDFEHEDFASIPNFKGGEKTLGMRMFDDGACKIMRGRLEPGASIGLHTHEGNSEIIYILEGTGKVEYDGGVETLAAGDCHYCPEHHTHRLINDSSEDLNFFAVVPQHHL